MYKTWIEDINKLDISESGDFDSFNVLWVAAFNKGNRDQLDFRAHTHTFFEVHFITKGSLCYHFDSGDAEVDTGSFLIIPPNCSHSMTQQSPDFRKLTISFESFEGTPFHTALFNKSKKTLPIPKDVLSTIDFLIRNAQSKAEYSDVIIKNRLYEMIALITDSYAPKSSQAPTNYVDPRLEKAKKYIDDNPQAFFICDEVAYYCRLSSKQIGRLFKQHENCSLLQYLHKKKIEQAKQLIRESDEHFEIISQKLGFSSVNYFGKFFTRYTGMTPGEYRKTLDKPAKIK